MTTDHLATPHGSPARASTAPPPDLAHGDRRTLVAAALASASVVEIGLLIWRPWGERNALGYDDIASIRDNVWLGALLDGVAFGVLAITLGVLVCQLVRTRGRTAASVGAALLGLGGILFAMGSMAHGAVAWVSTSHVISEKSARALFDLVDDQPLRVMAPVGAGFVLCALGMLVCAGALIRSGSVPRWLPITVAVLVLGQFAPLPGRALDVWQMGVMAAMIALAVVAVRRTPDQH